MQYGGNHDSTDLYQSKIVAIDAIAFFGKMQTQFTEKKVLRELNKAYVGFAFLDEHEEKEKEKEEEEKKGEKEKKKKKNKKKGKKRMPIATGSWGCGAFGGNHQLKAVIQLMAAAQAERDVVYCIWKLDKKNITIEDTEELHKVLVSQNVTVGM